jgi:osmoprotectant transport system substrate-binding protein
MRRARVVVIAIALLGLIAACGGTSKDKGGGVDRNKGDKGKVVVADAGFTESEILANMYADVLANIGYKTSVQSVKSAELFQSSLEKGSVVVAPQYVATYANSLQLLINGANAPTVATPELDPTFAILKTLAAKRGITPLEPSKAVDQNAFAVSKKFAKDNKLKTMSDLGKLGKPLKLAAGPECKTRPFCVPGLKKTYGITISKIDPLGVDTSESKHAVSEGADDVALVTTTDATVDSSGLVVLTDDKHLQNADNLVPVANTKKLKPDMEKALNELSAKLTTADMLKLNQEVTAGQRKPADVAADFLKDKGLTKK